MTQRFNLVDPEKEILIVRHSYLNGNSYDLGKVVDETLELRKHTSGKEIIPCLEGDIIQLEDTGEPVLTHRNFLRLRQEKFRDLRKTGRAATLTEALDRLDAYLQTSKDQRVVLCFEPKAITSHFTIEKTVEELRRRGIRDAYFDSFFGGALDSVDEANLRHTGEYAKSLHAVGNLGRWKITLPKPATGYDVLTVPKKLSVGNPGVPVIYGAVGSTKLLAELAERPNTVGAYVRFKEGTGLWGTIKMAFNSVTNTIDLRRKTTLMLYGSR